MDSDISQWVASLPLVPMLQETKLICLSRGAGLCTVSRVHISAINHLVVAVLSFPLANSCSQLSPCALRHRFLCLTCLGSSERQLRALVGRETCCSWGGLAVPGRWGSSSITNSSPGTGSCHSGASAAQDLASSGMTFQNWRAVPCPS